MFIKLKICLFQDQDQDKGIMIQNRLHRTHMNMIQMYLMKQIISLK